MTLTIPQIYNLARLLDVDQMFTHRSSNGHASVEKQTALPRAQAIKT